MLNYDLIVIGFGKAGKTLAAKMNAAGKKVAVIERSKAIIHGQISFLHAFHVFLLFFPHDEFSFH